MQKIDKNWDLFSDKWMKGIFFELTYWKNEINKNSIKEIEYKFNNRKSFELTHFTDKDILHHLQMMGIYKILDIGCGMNYLHKPAGLDIKIDYHFIDALAPFYNKLKEKYNVLIPDTEFSFVEYLTSFYNINSIPLIIITNALDHSIDPVKGIIECVNVLKIDGILWLEHYNNTAEQEHYRGLHQFNFDVRDDAFIIWNNDGYYINVNELLIHVASITCIKDLSKNYIKITKLNNATDFLTKDSDVFFLCYKLINNIESILSYRKISRLHFNRIIYMLFKKKLFCLLIKFVQFPFPKLFRKRLKNKIIAS